MPKNDEDDDDESNAAAASTSVGGGTGSSMTKGGKKNNKKNDNKSNENNEEGGVFLQPSIGNDTLTTAAMTMNNDQSSLDFTSSLDGESLTIGDSLTNEDDGDADEGNDRGGASQLTNIDVTDEVSAMSGSISAGGAGGAGGSVNGRVKGFRKIMKKIPTWHPNLATSTRNLFGMNGNRQVGFELPEEEFVYQPAIDFKERMAKRRIDCKTRQEVVMEMSKCTAIFSQYFDFYSIQREPFCIQRKRALI
jgi:hypothetical protein